MNMKQGRSWDMAHHPPMPRPNVIEKKWPDIKHALASFSIDAVARFGDSDIDRLLKNDGMIRSAKKISGVIANAQAMQQVQQEYGSFATYLHAVKAKGEEALLKDLRKRFAFLGESTSIMFLFGVGEEMPQTLQKMQEMHESTHSTG